MKLCVRLLCVVLSLFQLCFAMEKEPKQEAEYELLYSRNDDIVGKIVAAIKAAEKGTTIFMTQLFLTHDAVYLALKDFLEAKKGTVKLLVNRRQGKTRGYAQQLQRYGASLQLVKELHAKQCILAPKSLLFKSASDDQFEEEKKMMREPMEIESCVQGDGEVVIEKPDGKAQVFFMSENLSSLANEHLEYALHTHDPVFAQRNIELFQAHQAYYQCNTPERKQKRQKRDIEKDTPQKSGTILSTATSDVLACTNLRMRKALEPGMKEIIRISTMTLDADVLVQSLIKKAQDPRVTVQLIVDAAVVRAKKGRDLLKQLHEAGVDIRAYNVGGVIKAQGAIPALQHTKIVYRHRQKDGQEPEILTIFYTGNMTRQSNQEVNMASFHLNDYALGEKAVSLLDDLVRRSIKYEEIDLKEVERKQKERAERAKKRRQERKKKEKEAKKKAKKGKRSSGVGASSKRERPKPTSENENVSDNEKRPEKQLKMNKGGA